MADKFVFLYKQIIIFDMKKVFTIILMSLRISSLLLLKIFMDYRYYWNTNTFTTS